MSIPLASPRERRQPKVIVFSGPPCAGKSTLAQTLSKELGLPYLDMDQVRARLLPDSEQNLADRTLAYRAMHLCAERLMEVDQAVILVATYSRKTPRSELEEVCGRTGAALYIVECQVSPGLAVERYEAGRTNHPAVDLSRDRVELLATNFPYSRLGVVLNTSADMETSLRQIREYLCGATAVHGGWATLLQDDGAE
jgi:predicted kinase